jgi:coproporphyrinogen dehydrogenase HemZ
MKVFLNNKDFSQEVHETIKIFFPFNEVVFSNENFDFQVDISEDKIDISFPKLQKEFLYDLEVNMKASIRKFIYKALASITHIEPPWGILVGIRPSKIALKLISKGYKKEQITQYYKENYLASVEKAELCFNVAQYESKYIDNDIRKVSVYIGMPFCPTRCVYCSFASNPIMSCNGLVEPYLDTLIHEIKTISRYILDKGLEVECIYFGGGTPTSVNDKQFHAVMKSLYESFIIHHNIKEFTVECGRPDSITKSKLNSMKMFNVDRISINPQTMNDVTLRKIGRAHSVQDVIDRFNLARNMGFDNINMDVIVGLPGEGIDEVKITCNRILELNPDSLTVHGMSLKRASVLHEQSLFDNRSNGVRDLSEIYAMYDFTRSLAANLNMKSYYMYRQKNMVGNMENIGYCKKNKESIYNIKMIEENQNIFALGADAISKKVENQGKSIERFANVKDVKLYIERINEMIDGKVQLFNKVFY